MAYFFLVVRLHSLTFDAAAYTEEGRAEWDGREEDWGEVNCCSESFSIPLKAAATTVVVVATTCSPDNRLPMSLVRLFFRAKHFVCCLLAWRR